MTEAIYTLCALTSLACATLLLRRYAASRMRLLFWSGLCFAGLFANNVLVIVDKVLLPTQVDLMTLRLLTGLGSLLLLVYGLVTEDT